MQKKLLHCSNSSPLDDCLSTDDNHEENFFSTESEEQQDQSAKKDEGENGSVFTNEAYRGKKMEDFPYGVDNVDNKNDYIHHFRQLQGYQIIK